MPASVAGIVAQHHPAIEDTGATEPAAIVHLADRMIRGGESAPDRDFLLRIGLPASLLELPDWGQRLGRSPLNQALA
jgi:hypothetical protein